MILYRIYMNKSTTVPICSMLNWFYFFANISSVFLPRVRFLLPLLSCLPAFFLLSPAPLLPAFPSREIQRIPNAKEDGNEQEQEQWGQTEENEGGRGRQVEKSMVSKGRHGKKKRERRKERKKERKKGKQARKIKRK